jgi:hypothetical protein
VALPTIAATATSVSVAAVVVEPSAPDADQVHRVEALESEVGRLRRAVTRLEESERVGAQPSID